MHHLIVSRHYATTNGDPVCDELYRREDGTFYTVERVTVVDNADADEDTLPYDTVRWGAERVIERTRDQACDFILSGRQGLILHALDWQVWPDRINLQPPSFKWPWQNAT
ncbi:MULTISPECIES: hypothetical protein [unclassified Bradyrhizobium]|uniref:hypothetical protein n=1 Tax=unclassified Bradyrhizobium TaxID=2631580 RepID=UPI0028E5454A|nr:MULTISPECIES: hypothetical protein [unclassified Bradyrhizobium]